MIRRFALLALAATVAGTAQAEPQRRTWINPVDIDYRYNFEQLNDGISYRTGADPAVVNHKGVYYLFLTLADGYWRSTDLVDWTFVKPSRWPFHSVVAPAAWSDGERLYLMPATMTPEAIMVSDAPETGKLDFLTRLTPPLPGAVGPNQEDKIKPGEIPPGPWDPALFRDNDGKWFLYWNSSNVFPLYGIELDPKRELAYLGKAEPLIKLDPERHGWERFGWDHSGKREDGVAIDPYIEGAWMTKVNGRYYLQYAAPGTEYNVYANGTYVSDKPLGPFTYAPYNPVAYKPGGFVEGAGHGSTFQDRHGNWWNTGTPWIGYNWTFERRVAMFPTRFDADGQMEVSTRFGDFPQWEADRKVDNAESLFTGWMLLSYRKPASASSTLGEFAPARVTDENPRTFWVAARNEAGQTLTVDLGRADTLRAVQVNFADYKSGRFADAPDIYTAFKLEGSLDGKSWRPLAETGPERRDRPNAYLQLKAPVRARYVRYVHEHIGGANLAISDLRVFGNADGRPPARPAEVTATRDCDGRDGEIGWRAEPHVVGYNVRWGVRPDRLTLTYQKFFDQLDPKRPRLSLRSLNVGQDYWVAVEAFNETGVSSLSRVVKLDAACRSLARRP